MIALQQPQRLPAVQHRAPPTPKSDLEMLRMQIITCDGGQNSSQYRCENLLAADATVYCSKKRENINILLSLADDGPNKGVFVLTHFMVKAP